MLGYIVVYIIIGFIAGIIENQSKNSKNTSYWIMGIAALISLVTAGPFVIAAVIEMNIGWTIGQFISNKTNKNTQTNNSLLSEFDDEVK